MIHYGWAIVAALAGFLFGALLMSLMAAASNADRDAEQIFENARGDKC